MLLLLLIVLLVRVLEIYLSELEILVWIQALRQKHLPLLLPQLSNIQIMILVF